MREDKIGNLPERKSKPKFKQTTGRILSAVALMSTMGIIPGDYSPTGTDASSSINYSQSELMSSQELGKGPYCLFISGGSGTSAGISGIKEGLERQYGAGKVDVFNSALDFEDPQNPKRFDQMADFVQSHSKEGLDIVAHSLGAVELKKTIDIVKKRDEAFFDKKENVENVNIVLISPSGFSEGIKGPFRFLGRILRYGYEQGGLGFMSKSDSSFRGIDALTAFPPKGIKSQDLAEALRKAMPELSQLDKGQSAEIIPLQREDNYLNKLSDKEKLQQELYSAMMSNAIANGNYDGLRYLVIGYGKMLRKPLEQVYKGNFESTGAPILEATKATIGGYIELLNILVDAFGSKPMKELAKLKDKGVNVNFVIPEYDIIVPLDEAVAFFDGPDEASKHIKVAEGVAHAFPALHKFEFGEMIKNFQGDKTP